MLGKKHSEEFKKKRSEKWKSGFYDFLKKPIICNETNNEYPSIKDAADLMKLPKGSKNLICQTLKGNRKKKDIHGYTLISIVDK